ncbi:hypothetical protein LJC68_10380 [Bacteroidales bacterium OttesenSCG-928-B11]|nr:hypothetical protein [Bacteroidales bacterium OttesenSCG-928-B11]
MSAENPVGFSSVHARTNIRGTPHYSKPPGVTGNVGLMNFHAKVAVEKSVKDYPLEVENSTRAEKFKFESLFSICACG